MERQVTNYCKECQSLVERNKELLEILEDLMDWLNGDAPNDLYDRATAVIAKAKGEI